MNLVVISLVKLPVLSDNSWFIATFLILFFCFFFFQQPATTSGHKGHLKYICRGFCLCCYSSSVSQRPWILNLIYQGRQSLKFNIRVQARRKWPSESLESKSRTFQRPPTKDVSSQDCRMKLECSQQIQPDWRTRIHEIDVIWDTHLCSKVLGWGQCTSGRKMNKQSAVPSFLLKKLENKSIVTLCSSLFLANRKKARHTSEFCSIIWRLFLWKNETFSLASTWSERTVGSVWPVQLKLVASQPYKFN